MSAWKAAVALELLQVRQKRLDRVHVRIFRQQAPPEAVAGADVEDLRVPRKVLPHPCADLRLAIEI